MAYGQVGCIPHWIFFKPLRCITGSNSHQMRALKNPRWEDFNYESESKTKNRFWWFGNGYTYNEQTLTGDRELYRPAQIQHSNWTFIGAWYLRDDYVDVPPGMEHD